MNDNEAISQPQPTPVSYADLLADFLRLADEIQRRSGKRVTFSIGEDDEEVKTPSEPVACEAPLPPLFDSAYTRDRLHSATADLNMALMDMMGYGEGTMDRRLQEALLLWADAISDQQGHR